MVQWSQPTPFSPLEQTSGHSLWPHLYCKQQALSIGLMEIAGAVINIEHGLQSLAVQQGIHPTLV